MVQRMQSSGGVVNGIDSGKLMEVVESTRENPATAKLRLRAHNRWLGGGHGQSAILDFQAGGQEMTHHSTFTMEADEPDVLLGTDKGPNATEAHLHALASCLNATFIYHAAAKGVRIDELELEMEGELDLRGFLGIDPKVRNGYTRINVTFRVKSEAPREQIEELVKLAQLRSPVFDITTNPTPVEVKLEQYD